MYPVKCSNYKPISKYLGECSILLQFGIKYIHGENRANNPCIQCQKEWVNNQEPTKDTLTPKMNLILKANGKIELPTITERAVSFGKALANWAFQGFQNVPEIYQQERQKICEANTCGLYDKEQGSCTGCGCLISIKKKFSTEKCPAELWPSLPPEILHQANPGGCGSCGRK